MGQRPWIIFEGNPVVTSAQSGCRRCLLENTGDFEQITLLRNSVISSLKILKIEGIGMSPRTLD